LHGLEDREIELISPPSKSFTLCIPIPISNSTPPSQQRLKTREGTFLCDTELDILYYGANIFNTILIKFRARKNFIFDLMEQKHVNFRVRIFIDQIRFGYKIKEIHVI
jgi:hypothetical protein